MVHFRRTHNLRLRRLISESGGSLPIVKIREKLSNREALAIEASLINAIGRGDAGPLFNLTDGGEGTVGWEMPIESRKKIGDALRGKKQSDDHLKKLSEIRKGKILSEQSRAKLSESMKKLIKTPEHRAAISAAKKGKLAGPMPNQQKIAIGNSNRGKKRIGAALDAIRNGQLKRRMNLQENQLSLL